MFIEKIKNYDLLVIKILELVEIVLQPQMSHDLINCNLIHYVHVVMHLKQLNLVMVERIIDYNVEVLKENVIVQSMHVITTKLIFLNILKRKIKKKRKRKRKTKQQSGAATATTPTPQNFLKMILILTPYCNIKILHVMQLVLMINLILFMENINNNHGRYHHHHQHHQNQHHHHQQHHHHSNINNVNNWNKNSSNNTHSNSHNERRYLFNMNDSSGDIFQNNHLQVPAQVIQIQIPIQILDFTFMEF